VPSAREKEGTFHLPNPKGFVQVISMRYSVRYAGKSKALEIVSNPDECVLSILSWETMSDGIMFTFVDKAGKNLQSDELRALSTCQYKWKTNKQGKFVIFHIY